MSHCHVKGTPPPTPPPPLSLPLLFFLSLVCISERQTEGGYMQMDTFPAGLRVLVVDDDMTWLKILEKMLRKCSYEVTTCSFARNALNMLRERKERFDIVISDVNMPDMDGFKLLEHVGLEMDLPVIMMSVDGETSRVMKGVQHGACDYLLKPIRMKELRNIWQHVFRKKKHEVKEIEGQDHESSHGIQMKNGFDEFEDELLFSSIDPNATKKRKDMGNEDHGSHEFNSNLGTVKKARVVWSVELHQKFVNAVNQIGLDKVGPKKILDLMNVPGLTRENVASHLQKYRLYLSRLQKQNEANTSFCGVKQSDFNCKDHPGKFGHPSSTTTQQNLPNSFGYSSNKSSAQDVVPEAHDNESKSIVSFLPVTEAKNSLKGDSPVDQKLTTLPEIGEVLLFGAILPDANCTSFGSINSQQQSWSGESSVAPLMQRVKQDHESYLPLEGYPHLPLLGEQHYIQVDSLQTSASCNVRKCITDRDKVDPPVTKPFYTDYKSNHVRSVSPTASRTNSFPVQLDHDFVNQPVFGALAANSASSSTKKHDLNQNCIGSWGSPPSLVLKNESFSASLYENLQNRALQGCGGLENVWLDDLELFDFRDSSSVTELQSYMYDGLRSSCDYQCDSPEYPVIDEGVFIA